jgi:multiple sugar transport system permease protein
LSSTGAASRRQSLWGWALISPWVLGFLIFTLGPMLYSFWLSFQKYDLSHGEFVGGENYRRLLTQDPLYWKSLFNTFLYALLAVPLGVAGSLGAALLLNAGVRGQALFRTLFYLPTMVPSVASAILWIWVLNPESGILNVGLGYVGVDGPSWLQDEKWALPAFVLMSLWGIGGARMVIFLAGLQGVSDSYYEAATLDGAGAWKRFRYVTWPLISPVTFFNMTIGLIGAMGVFTSAYVMTGGGPNNATLFYNLYLYRNAFEYFKLGKASAMAWLMLVILLALTLLQFRAAKRWVHYEGDAG